MDYIMSAINPIPMRWRPYSLCRALDHARPVDLTEMRVDRLKVSITADVHYRSRDAITEYLSFLGGNNSLPVDLFELHDLPTPHKRRLRVRPGFLLSGEGEVKNVAELSGVARVVLSLDLNPTRWLAHQPLPPGTAPLNMDALAALPAHQALAEHSEVAASARRAALDGNDNVALGFRRTGDFTPARDHAAWFRRVLAVYLEHVRALVTAVLTPTTNDAIPVTVTVHPFAVQQAECYAEQNTPDAIAAMATLADRLKVAASDMTIRHYLPADRLEEGMSLNARSVTLKLTNTVHLCIYAKTRDRIRFEVRYLSAVQGTVARHLRGQQPNILEILEEAMSDAANRLNTVNRALTQIMTDAPVDWQRLINFMAELLWACGSDYDRARALLSPLVIDQAVCETVPGGLAPRAVMQRLHDRRIVERVRVRHGGPVRWRLTPPYAAIMRGLGDQLPDRRRLAEIAACGGRC
jgi:hypothetical protein